MIRKLCAIVVSMLAAALTIPACAVGVDDTAGSDMSEEEPVAETSQAFSCPNCVVQCLKYYDQYGNPVLGNPYPRGPHSDCWGTALAFCRDKWGYDPWNAWCG